MNAHRTPTAETWGSDPQSNFEIDGGDVVAAKEGGVAAGMDVRTNVFRAYKVASI